MTYDELKKALECHAVDDKCGECPFYDSENCIGDMVHTVLNALDKRQMVLKTVMMALDKGRYSVTVNPTGEVWIRPCGAVCYGREDDDTGEIKLGYRYCPNCGSRMDGD